MHQTVVLQHTLPGGSSHHDWLIDQPRIAHEKRLLSFRCQTRPDRATEPFSALQLPPHRAHYLEYQGPVSPARGHVTRVATGEVLRLDHAVDTISLSVRWDDRLIHYTALPATPSEPSEHPRWRFLPLEHP